MEELLTSSANSSLTIGTDKHDGSGDTKQRSSSTGDDVIVVVTGENDSVSVCDKATTSRKPLHPDVIAGYFKDLASNDAPSASDLAESQTMTSDADMSLPYLPTDDTEELIKRIDEFLSTATFTTVTQTTPAKLETSAEPSESRATEVTPDVPVTTIGCDVNASEAASMKKPTSAENPLSTEGTMPNYSAPLVHKRTETDSVCTEYVVVCTDSDQPVKAIPKTVVVRKSKSRATRCTPNRTAPMISRDITEKIAISAASTPNSTCAVLAPPVSPVRSTVSTPNSPVRDPDICAVSPRVTRVVRTSYLCKPSKRDQKSQACCSAPAQFEDSKKHNVIDYPTPARTSCSGWVTRKRSPGRSFRRKSAS